MRDVEASEHRHVDYIRIWVVLVALLGVSVVLALLHQRQLAAVLILALATLKAFLVLSYYMHLRFEPRFIALTILAGFLCLAILFLGLTPDIVHVYGR
jgi:cytochrome c oxidase subunit IV